MSASVTLDTQFSWWAERLDHMDFLIQHFEEKAEAAAKAASKNLKTNTWPAWRDRNFEKFAGYVYALYATIKAVKRRFKTLEHTNPTFAKLWHGMLNIYHRVCFVHDGFGRDEALPSFDDVRSAVEERATVRYLQ